MAVYKEVVVQYHDEGEPFQTIVSIDEVWNGIDEDENIFFYFANEQEFQNAKQINNDYEFRIIS